MSVFFAARWPALFQAIPGFKFEEASSSIIRRASVRYVDLGIVLGTLLHGARSAANTARCRDSAKSGRCKPESPPHPWHLRSRSPGPRLRAFAPALPPALKIEACSPAVDPEHRGNANSMYTR